MIHQFSSKNVWTSLNISYTSLLLSTEPDNLKNNNYRQDKYYLIINIYSLSYSLVHFIYRTFFRLVNVTVFVQNVQIVA